MAKRVSTSAGPDEDTAEIPVASPPVESAAPAEPPATIRKFRVHLKAPTPLAENPAVIEAANEADAWDRFMALNRIGGSDHERTVEPVQE